MQNMEIERKYLVKEIPDLTNCEILHITQGYISINPEMRIRKCNNQYDLTVKSNGTLVRQENISVINEFDFINYAANIQGRFINKNRFVIKIVSGDKIYNAELDIFLDEFEGLKTVEVEMDSLEEAESFVPPTWFGMEITEDKRYKNKYLALANEEQLEEIIPLKKYERCRKYPISLETL